MDKLAWVLLPLLIAAAWLALLAWRGRVPARPVLNVWFSVLLLVYVGTTAGLGIFWVANQHLPAFDWHYLFGYTTVLLLVVHLAFNFRIVWRHWTRVAPAPPAPVAPQRSRRPLLAALGLLLAAGGGYLVGLRHGRTELRIEARGANTAAADGSALALVERFHEFSAHSRRGVFRRAPAVDWGDAPPPFKDGAGQATLGLPAAGTATPPGLALDALASLLWHSAGVNLRRGTVHFRTAPSSGALFATELHVCARDVPGLAPGLWHYDAQHHALRRLADAAPDAPALGTDIAARAHVLASAVFRRSGHKYRDRAYRYMLADLGHSLENLRVAAAALGIAMRFAPAFDESRAAAALGLDEAEEGLLALVALEPLAREAGAVTGAGWRPADLATNATLGVTEAIHRATSLRLRPASAMPGQAPAAGPAPMAAPEPTPSVVLPLPQPHRVAPLEAIARRRSIRRYAGTALSRPALSALLDACARRQAPILSDAIRVSVVTHAAEGLPAAAWSYLPRAHGLLRRPRDEPGALSAASRHAALDQDVIGDAAAVFVLTIDRAAMARDAAGAARGYRHAFLEAGLMGERLYLEGVALGLGVCGVGAFYDDEVSQLVGVDPAREWVVHLAAVGVPA